MLQLRALISGYVQGVCFRYYAVQKANDLGLKGFVKNLANGRVEVVAQGNKIALLQLLEWLQKGPSGASVEGVESEWGEAGKKFSEFSVKY